MYDISDSGVFVKRFSRNGEVSMKSYAHRDDYYIMVLLAEGEAAVEIDFELKRLKCGDLLIVSPWQVHNRPAEETWMADGWMLAISPEMLTEPEAKAIDEYAVSTSLFHPDKDTASEIAVLCGMMERNRGKSNISVALASAVKSIVLASVASGEESAPGRYRAITLRFKKLLDLHLTEEKRPKTYASMLHISEVYLNEAVKGSTGISAGAYIRQRAMVQARRQLAYTSLSSKEIAYALGYEDYAWFSKLFKKYAGVSPSDYRKNLK